jgi:hypothetical protein
VWPAGDFDEPDVLQDLEPVEDVLRYSQRVVVGLLQERWEWSE